MRLFKKDKKLYWVSGIKSWVSMILFLLMLVWIFGYFWATSRDKIIVLCLVMLVSKISRNINKNFVAAVRIDAPKNEISFLLKIIISGEKIKKYDLSQARVTLIKNEGFSKFFNAPYKMTISFAPYETYVITEQDGFSYETLSLLRDAIVSETVNQQQ